MVPGGKSSKCNTFEENFSRSFPTKRFSGAIIEQIFDMKDLLSGNSPEIKTLREEKTNQIIGVLINTSLLGFMRLGKVDHCMKVFLQ